MSRRSREKWDTPEGRARLLGYLKMILDQRRALFKDGPSHVYPGMEGLLLAHGRFWEAQPLPKNFVRGERGQCFKNAWRLAVDNGLWYCEGVALSVIPTLHAWCVDDRGHVYDPTWNNPERCLYHGMVFDTKYVLRLQAATRCYASVLDNYMMGFPLFSGEHTLTEAQAGVPEHLKQPQEGDDVHA